MGLENTLHPMEIKEKENGLMEQELNGQLNEENIFTQFMNLKI